MSEPATDRPTALSRSRLVRAVWLMFGLLAVAIGAVGIIVPGLPTTVFFIVAAWAFSRSSPRLEAWLLALPRIGPLVHDHRDGLGMPRRAKQTAIAMIIVFVGLSSWLLDGWIARGVVIGAGVVGVAYIWLRVPTKEQVLAERGEQP